MGRQKPLVVNATLDDFEEVHVLDDDTSASHGIDVRVDQFLRSREIRVVRNAIRDLFL
jgi:hypothetical protein